MSTKQSEDSGRMARDRSRVVSAETARRPTATH